MTSASTALLELFAVLLWVALINYPSTPHRAPAPPAAPKAATIMETQGEWDPELLAHEAGRRQRLADASRAPAASRASSSSSSDSGSSRSASRGSGFRFRLPKIRIGHDDDGSDAEEVLRD